MSHYDPVFVEIQDLRTELNRQELNISEDIRERVKNIEELMMAREKFCADHTSDSSVEVQAIAKATLNHPWNDLFQEGKIKFNMKTSMMSGNVTGCFLQFLVSSSKARNVLEIGTFTGCSALRMAEVLPPDGKVTACDFDPYVVEFARNMINTSPHGTKIEILLGYAKETLPDLAKKGSKFDFIFIDADKKRYVDYFKICLDSLLAPGGTMVIDNAMFYGTAYATKPRGMYGDHTRQFNEAVKQRQDIYHVLLPVRDGIMLVKRKTDMNG